MNKVQRDLSYFGHHALDNFEIMQYIRQPLRPSVDKFSVLINTVNVSLLQPDELHIYVLNGSKIEIRAKHERKKNVEGLWMTLDAVYTYELPSECCNKTLEAQWFTDNYLRITASSLQADEKEYVDKIRLVPERVESQLNPTLYMPAMKEFVEDILNRAQNALQYMRLAVRTAPSSVEKDIQDMVDKQSGVTSMTGTGVTSKDDSPVKPNDETCSNAGKD